MAAIDPRSSFTPHLPDQFGKYSLLGHLATGGMAEVWLARQVGLEGFEKIVVIKRARPELSDSETTRRFLDEARLVGTLEHPNIAQVYEIGSVGGSYFFVMEYVDGADLRRLIETAIARHRPVSLADALYIIIHVCAALHYAHEKRDLEGRPLQIVHRDVTPSNVLLSHDGTIKVCDFGIAKAHNREAENTQNGVLKGKFSYMSPEQCESKPVDRRSDVFSIGILLYELSTLSKLFRGSSDFALLQKIIEAPVPPPSSRMPSYPPELERIVMKALAKSPADRYPTAQALQLDLEDFAREHKLAMSSIRIGKLMGSLFERRNDAWIRAQRALSSDQAIVDKSGSANQPGFLAVGSAPSRPSVELITEYPGSQSTQSGRLARGSQGSPTSQTSQSAVRSQSAISSQSAVSSMTGMPAAHRSPALWLIGAVLAGIVAVAVTVADQMIASAGDKAIAGALSADAERISAVLDAAARSAHMRADGIATTPMLRAAIETDAATLRDLASTEMVFTAEPGETLEVFQVRGDQLLISVLRLPRTASALRPIAGRETQLISDGQSVVLAASAPISGYGAKIAGGLVIATPVDLSAIRRALDDHAIRAQLTGLGKDVALAGPADNALVAPTAAPAAPPAALSAPVRLAVPSSGAWGATTATLVVTPKQAIGLPWAWQARTASGGLAGLLLVGFVVGLVRRPRS